MATHLSTRVCVALLCLLQLRQELSAQRIINDETADETTKILADLSKVQQANARLTSDLALKVRGQSHAAL